MLTRINDTLLTRVLTLAILVGAVLAATGILIFAPTAHADADSWLSDLSAAGYNSRAVPDEWMTIGQDICGPEAFGTPRSTIANNLVISMGKGIYYNNAEAIIDIANKDLCQGASSDFGPYKS